MSIIEYLELMKKEEEEKKLLEAKEKSLEKGRWVFDSEKNEMRFMTED